jgi:menaquinone-9 beta-reductase
MTDIEQSQSIDSRVLVIGAGVAGCAFALRLRQCGIHVDLVEKESFPRAKVCGCCLGPLGIEQLQLLGLLDRARERAVVTNHWQASLGGRMLDLDIPEGIAISREILDPMMVEAAQSAGVQVTMQCTASIESVDAQNVVVRFGQQAEKTTKTYDCVIIASGLRAGNLKGMLPWIEEPHGPFGVSFTAEISEIAPGTIYMACDSDGYVGLVRLASGHVDVAAALVSGSEEASKGNPMHRVEQILHRSVFRSMQIQPLTPLMATPALRRSRVAGDGRIIAIGDAAGYVEPFTGEGMTWAMQDGISAADLVAEHRHDLGRIGQRWSERVNRSTRQRKMICRIMTTALRSPIACRVAATTLGLFPSLARPLLNHRRRKP